MRAAILSVMTWARVGGHGKVGVGQVDGGLEVAVEGVGKSAQGGGLAGADVAGD